MSSKWILFLFAFSLLLASCGPVAAPPPQATIAPQALPPTWTPTQPTAIPKATEYPTFTPVPAFTPLGTPTNDSLGALSERFQDSLFSTYGSWVAYREADKLRVVNKETERVWTLPCELFKECSTVYPVRWSRNGQVLYFAPAPTVGSAPRGISQVTAMGMINVKTGKWQIVLPDSDHYYDFTFSPDEEYLAYTKSSGTEVDKPVVTMGVVTIKKNKAGQEVKLKEAYGGNIVWSPFKPRFVFVVQSPNKGSSVVYYDLETTSLKYVLIGEQADVILLAWNEGDNLIALEEKDWRILSRSYWTLNAFTGEMSPADITATPEN